MINFDPRKFVKSENKPKQEQPKSRQANLVELRDKVFKIIQLKGAVLPIEISKQIEMNTMFSGAILSELFGAGKIKISHSKIGGSPLYYVPERKANLSRLYEYLNEKDKRAYDLLKKEEVLNDDDLTPLMSVAMRQIKDFAIPIDVTFKNSKGEEENLSLWKWYLLDDKKMNEKISDLINSIKGMPQKEEDEEDGIANEDENSSNDGSSDDLENEVKQGSEQKILHSQSEEPKDLEGDQKQIKPVMNEEYKKEIEEEEKRIEEEVEKKYEKPKEKEEQKEHKELKESKKEIKLPQSKSKPKKQKQELELGPEQKTLIDKEEIKSQSDFLKTIINYFENNNIDISDVDIIRKSTEANFVIKIPSIIGKINYFCKAKSKGKINDKDVSAVYIEAQSKKLPVLLLITGDYTKKAKELVEKDLKNIIIKKI